ncbi:hypothetical protein LSAT2_007533 [Lamellibrachia satsuma]|nr:hypothetical protein LSAT2_007533 [Lamellibrachia satsuma]
MDTLLIARLLAMDPRTRSIFRGVVPKDGLYTTRDALRAAFVCNTDVGDKLGEHWIAFYLDADGRGDYFCSYGLPPRHAMFRTFMNEHYSEWTHNNRRLQNPLSNVCGQYCVAYVLLLCNGFPMRTFVNIFGTDLVANDCRVFDWFKQLRQGQDSLTTPSSVLSSWFRDTVTIWMLIAIVMSVATHTQATKERRMRYIKCLHDCANGYNQCMRNICTRDPDVFRAAINTCRDEETGCLKGCFNEMLWCPSVVQDGAPRTRRRAIRPLYLVIIIVVVVIIIVIIIIIIGYDWSRLPKIIRQLKGHDIDKYFKQQRLTPFLLICSRDKKERNGREDKWIEGKGSGGDSSEGVGCKETIVKAMGLRETRGKATGAQVSAAKGGGDRLMSERERS